jgi:glycosyltransferase involved in cell wall biosynthesis
MTTNARPVLLDVTRLIWRRWVGRLPTGIDRVCLAYLEHYRSNAQAVIQSSGFRRILGEKASDRLFKLLLHPRQNIRRDLALFHAREGMRPDARLPGRGRLYLNVGHTALQKPSFVEWTRAADVRPIFMVHDLIPITHPEYCRAGEAERHGLRVRNMLASAVGIIGNSQATLDSLAAFAREVSAPTPAMIAASLGTDLKQGAGGAPSAPERPTFVMLGTIEARKNHLLLLKIWARLVHAHGPHAPRLLVIGQRGWECEQVVDLRERRVPLQDALVEIGACSDAALDSHLRGARALLFPSLVEGYGLPLIEALASGTPVIASDLPVFREIGQGVPDFLDPLDGPAWQTAILDYAQADSPMRAAQIARIAAYRAPDWDGHFASVDRWMRTL